MSGVAAPNPLLRHGLPVAGLVPVAPSAGSGSWAGLLPAGEQAGVLATAQACSVHACSWPLHREFATDRGQGPGSRVGAAPERVGLVRI